MSLPPVPDLPPSEGPLSPLPAPGTDKIAQGRMSVIEARDPEGRITEIATQVFKTLQEAKAEAEKRRAMAVAREQEMRALVVENEAKVPLAMAEAFLKGNLGVMDYYRMKNISADTSMRDSIAKPKKKE